MGKSWAKKSRVPSWLGRAVIDLRVRISRGHQKRYFDPSIKAVYAKLEARWKTQFLRVCTCVVVEMACGKQMNLNIIRRLHVFLLAPLACAGHPIAHATRVVDARMRVERPTTRVCTAHFVRCPLLRADSQSDEISFGRWKGSRQYNTCTRAAQILPLLISFCSHQTLCMFVCLPPLPLPPLSLSLSL